MDKAIYLRAIYLEKEFINAYGTHSLRTGLFQKSFGKFYDKFTAVKFIANFVKFKFFFGLDSEMVLVSMLARAAIGIHTNDFAFSANIFIDGLLGSPRTFELDKASSTEKRGNLSSSGKVNSSLQCLEKYFFGNFFQLGIAT